MPFDNESDGTSKLIAVLPVILVALREGRLVIIDELDAKLHPKLLRYGADPYLQNMLSGGDWI